ncbi:MAG: aminotransferase class V-fold PLP-dependent enzyme [Oscillospiraceae bacterium]|nr:aminotransferase class V-fold PLP-dependent enzyme [Oscillospiraceae bacterium]
MIYLDCAATALQKPPEVSRAVQWAMAWCASPGRGDHPASKRAAEVLFRARETAAGLFGARGPEQVVFTTSATHGLNIAIRSVVKPGSRVVISGYEHNAVTRTLASIPEVEVVVAKGERLFDSRGDLGAFRTQIDGGATAVICTHVSNVFGYRLPIDEIAQHCHEKHVPLIVDASQSAGVLPVSLSRWNAAAIAMPGHKGLCGPQGTGLLLLDPDFPTEPLLTGGTGTDSKPQEMPDFLPDRLEAGTHNVPGIAGLLAGMQAVRKREEGQILFHEQMLADELRRRLSVMKQVEVFGPERSEDRTGVLSFRVREKPCEQMAEELGKRGIALRAGLHCAPLAHDTAGTLETGTIRASVSPYTTREEICALARTVAQLL